MIAAKTFIDATGSLRRNILRSLLTILGIVIGIAAVIVMVEIGQGSSTAIANTIASMGANNLVILPGAAASGGVSYGSGSKSTLTPEDAAAVQLEVPYIQSSTPVVRARAQIIRGERNWVPQSILGVSPSFLVVRDWEQLAAGEMFTERDVRNVGKVCVIGETLVRELFNGGNAIGQELRVQNVIFKVVGVLKSKGANMMGSDQDDVLIAPWTTIKFRITGSSLSTSGTSSTSTTTPNKNNSVYPSESVSLFPAGNPSLAIDAPKPTRTTTVDQILAATSSAEQMPEAIEQITEIIRERHRIKPGDPEDFTIRDMTEIAKTLTTTTKLMTRLLLSVALISLVVGGVGIMNIMLVSVTERTREIGLRMAVGAESGDILSQFLVESLVLCLIGGVIGICLGRGTSWLIALLLRWPIEISVPAIVGAVLVSMGVGVVFGFYPAWKASKMDPIEALRFD